MNELVFPQLLLNVYSEQHYEAIKREAERAGYRLSKRPYAGTGIHEGAEVQHVVLTSSGSMQSVYYPSTLVECRVSGKKVNTKQIRGNVQRARSIKSKDNQATLEVRPLNIFVDNPMPYPIDPCDICICVTSDQCYKKQSVQKIKFASAGNVGTSTDKVVWYMVVWNWLVSVAQYLRGKR